MFSVSHDPLLEFSEAAKQQLTCFAIDAGGPLSLRPWLGRIGPIIDNPAMI